MTIDKASAYRNEVISLLKTERLPFEDLTETLDDLIVAIQDCTVIGVAGMEVYGDYGLLRSVAVAPGYRKNGAGAILVQEIERLARLKNLKSLYLLTTTAAAYFRKKGYETTSRDSVPADLQLSTQFKYSCPQSATVMQKHLIL